MIANPWYFRDALVRIRTGWRVRWKPYVRIDGKPSAFGHGTYIIYGPFGDVGVCENASHALAFYMLQCELGPQVPLKPTFRDILDWQDGPVTQDRHESTVSDGVETADCHFEPQP